MKPAELVTERETTVEHLRNARQVLENLKADFRDALNTGYNPVGGWLEQVEAADKRIVKAMVQITNAVASVDSTRRALTP